MEEEVMVQGHAPGANPVHTRNQRLVRLQPLLPALAVVLMCLLTTGLSSADSGSVSGTTAPCPEYPDASALIEHLEGMQAQASGLDLEALKDAVTLLSATRVQRDAVCARLEASVVKLEACRESVAVGQELLEGCRSDREQAWKELRASILKPVCAPVTRFGWTAGGGPCYTAERGDLTVCAAVVWGLHF